MSKPSHWGSLKVYAPEPATPQRSAGSERQRHAFATIVNQTPAGPGRPSASVSVRKPMHVAVSVQEVRTRQLAQSHVGSHRAERATDEVVPTAVDVFECSAPLEKSAVLGPVHSFPLGEEALPLHAALALLEADAAEQGRTLIAHLTTTVTDFCNNPAVRESEAWHISISMNDRILAATTLHMKLTLHWLILRFECRSEQAKHLILKHKASLSESLEAIVSPRRDISIDVD